jgi:signal transduction histidine kinase
MTGHSVDEPSTGAAPEFWERTQRLWHTVLYVLLAGLAVLMIGQTGLTTTERAAALGLLAGIAVAYTVAGRRALGSDRLGWALAYLVPAWLAVVVLSAIAPAGYALLFILFPQTWAMLPRTWQAVTWTLVAAGALALLQAWQAGFGDDAAAEAGLTFVANAGLSLLLGLWITGIVRESERRAQLIAALRHAQAELADAERTRGVLEERERLAHEIHDTLAQGFTSVLTLAQAIEAGWEHDPRGARERLSLLQDTARANLGEARALVAALSPVDLDGTDLPEALRRLVDRFSRETGMSARLDVVGEPRALPRATEVVLLRAAQEGLTNVRKHAGATHATITLGFGAGETEATLDVVDDGRGVNGAAEGFGLRGMRERAGAVGGEVTVGPGRDGGTRLHVDVH